MRNLLRNYFYRTVKEKAIYIGLLFSVLMSFLSVILFQTDSVDQVIKMKGKNLFLSALTPTNNMAILIPILIFVILNREYSDGAIRNKIISGYSRKQIYAAMYITNIVFGTILFMFNMVINLVVGSLILGYGGKINATEVNHLIEISLMAIFIYMVFLTVAHAMVHWFKNMSYIAYIIFNLSMAGISVIPQAVGNKGIGKVINDFNPVNQIANLYEKITDSKFIVVSIVSTCIYVVIILIYGIYKFEKADLK